MSEGWPGQAGLLRRPLVASNRAIRRGLRLVSAVAVRGNFERTDTQTHPLKALEDADRRTDRQTGNRIFRATSKQSSRSDTFTQWARLREIETRPRLTQHKRLLNAQQDL